MDAYAYPESLDLFQRAKKVIPAGIYGHYNPSPLLPHGDYPLFGARAEGARFWDVDGNEFIDYTCAYGPMILGYHHPAVDRAFEEQLKRADVSSLASPRLVELAECLVDLVPVADWATFAKNGADVTNFAVTIARAATGRSKIVAIEGGYHGTAPWMKASGDPGILESDLANTIRIPWNDLSALERAIDGNPGDIAGFIATPYHHPVLQDSEMPAEGYWAGVQARLNKEGIVLISDDVRCGFRIDLGGSNEYFGYKPDLICFGKALSNGYPISALAGTDALKDAAKRVFHTGSHWFSAAPMAAALACLAELKSMDAPRVILDKGTELLAGLTRVAESHGYKLHATGVPSMPYLRIGGADDPAFHQAICGECTKRGAFFTSHHNWFLSTAHRSEDFEHTNEILDEAFQALK